MLQRPVAEHILESAVWDILEDERKVNQNALPETGISQDMELLLSSTFIQSPMYGTRCSNFLRLYHHTWNWLEKTQQGEQSGQIVQQRISLTQQK